VRQALRILITNNTLAERGGSELYARDVASSLLRRGHTPIVYSTRLGEVAQELRELTIPVVDNLGLLAEPPDLIHGHHHVETMTALLHFPNVPAVSFCHGFLPWEEIPPSFPRILRYVAVDHTCRDRLICEHAIPSERVRVVLNFVDLRRFEAREPLPKSPRRGLIFSNQMRESVGVPAVRDACARAGIELDVVGKNEGGFCARPELVVGRYDIVFAKARCALEALAVGTAVVLCDTAGAGPMVTTTNLDELRRLNFGIRTLQESLQAGVIEREIARYDPADAAEVSRRIRATSDLEAAVDQILAVYQEVLTEHTTTSISEPAAEGRAAAEYLRWMATHLRNESLRSKNALLELEDYLRDSRLERLRRRLLRMPLLGPSANFLARKTIGPNRHSK
jgi:Glycosyltransferase Family 4